MVVSVIGFLPSSHPIHHPKFVSMWSYCYFSLDTVKYGLLMCFNFCMIGSHESLHGSLVSVCLINISFVPVILGGLGSRENAKCR